MRRHLAGAAELDAMIIGPLAVLASAGPDQLAFELSQATKHRDHQLAVRRSGVRPRVLKRTEAGAALADLVEHVEKVPGRARQAVETGDDQNIPKFQPADCLSQLGPIGLRAAGLLPVNLGAARSPKLGVLRSQVLIAG